MEGRTLKEKLDSSSRFERSFSVFLLKSVLTYGGVRLRLDDSP